MNGEGREEVVVRVPVRYAETDQQGVVYHAHYLVWMEIGRTALLAAIGWPYDRLEAEGTLFSVVEATCRWSGAARYGDAVEVATRLARLRSRSVDFVYRIERGGRAIAEGATTLVCLDRARRPRRVPAPLAAALTGRAAAD